MTHPVAHRVAGWTLGALMVVALSSPAAATCTQVRQLLSQGMSVGEVAATLGAPIAAVQTCLQPRSTLIPANRVMNPAGPPPLGAAGPPPLGAAGPAPLGAAGPAPRGAAGPAPHNAPGPPPFGAPGP